MPVSALKTLAPEFPWDAFLAETAHSAEDADGSERYVIVAEKTAFGPLAKIFAATPVSTWRDYLTVHYLHTFAAYLPKRFDDLDFAFYGTVLSGRTQQLDRKTRGVHLLDSQMGEALGKLYVARYFPPESKAKADLLVANLLKAYEADIQTLDWMSPATRAKALEKIQPVHAQDRLSRPSGAIIPRCEIVRDDLIGNVQRAARVRMEPRRRAHQPAGGQDRMGHDAVHHQRLLQSVLQRDRVSRPPSCSRPSSIPTPTTR